MRKPNLYICKDTPWHNHITQYTYST